MHIFISIVHGSTHRLCFECLICVFHFHISWAAPRPNRPQPHVSLDFYWHTPASWTFHHLDRVIIVISASIHSKYLYIYTAARVRVGFVLQMSPAAAMLVMQASTEFASAHSHELKLWNWIYKNTQLARDFSSRQIYMISPPFNTPFNSAVCCTSYLYRKKLWKTGAGRLILVRGAFQGSERKDVEYELVLF